MSGITNQFIANDSKRLFPPYNNLQSQMNANYKSAQTYYKAREKMFKKYLVNSAHITLEQFQEELNQKARSFNAKVVDEAKTRLLAALNEQPIPPLNPDNQTYEVHIDELVKQGVAFHTKNGNSRAIVREGFVFEKYLADRVLNNSQCQKLNNCGLELVGAIKQIASTTSKKTAIRSDLAINTSNIPTSDLKFELTTVLDIEDLSQFGDDILADLLIDAITENGVSQNLFGFQVKAYDSSDGTRWMNSIPLANALNDIFDAANEEAVTWSNNYAAIYPFYFLSRYLINIINPVNVGVITKEGMEYTSDFLDHYRLYMEVAWNWHKKNPPAATYRGGGEEVSNVHVVGNTILMRQVTQGKRLALQAKNIRSSQRGIQKKVANVRYT